MMPQPTSRMRETVAGLSLARVNQVREIVDCPQITPPTVAQSCQPLAYRCAVVITDPYHRPAGTSQVCTGSLECIPSA